MYPQTPNTRIKFARCARRTSKPRCGFSAAYAARYALKVTMRLFIIITMGLIVQMANSSEEYKNPVDGKSYIADWKTYKPEGGVVEQKGRVVNSGITLLSTQEEIKENITVDELSKLILYTQDLLTNKAQSFNEAGEVILQISLNKDTKPEFKMSYQGDLKQELLQKYYEALTAIDVKTKKSTILFQVHFIIKNA